MALKALALALALAMLAAAAIAAGRRRRPAGSARILDPEGPPLIDAVGGARSVQAAELPISPAQLAALWSLDGLERLARTYWRFLPRISLGLIQVRHTEAERLIVLVGRPLVLLSFGVPEYELGGDRGSVRWPIRGGLLLARRGRPSHGSLELGVRRLSRPPGRPAAIRVEVAVADFAPSIAGLFGRRVYAATQARIHVLVSRAFLRSLADLDLEIAGAPRGSPAGG